MDGSGKRLNSEKCLLVAVDVKQRDKRQAWDTGYDDVQFTVQESLSELSELVGTAGLQVGLRIQFYSSCYTI